MSILGRIKAMVTGANRTRPDIVRGTAATGTAVTPSSALQYVPLFACVSIVADAIASMPVDQVVKVGTARKPAPRQDIPDLLSMPNNEMSGFTMLESLMGWALTWGNGVCEIETTNGGQPAALHLITPDRVNFDRERSGRLVYDIRNDGNRNTVLHADQVLHLHGMGYDGVQGYSPIRLAREAIGVGLAAEQFGASFFKNGVRASGIIEYPHKMNEAQLKKWKADFLASQAGSENTGSPILLTGGLKWTSISIPPEDAQFLETRGFQVLEVCRMYRVPPHMVYEMGSAPVKSLEQLAIEFVRGALLPWVLRFEAEIDRKLITRPGESVKFNVESLLRGDTKSRGEWYKLMSHLGVYTINMILALENQPGIGPLGDMRLVPSTMIPLERVAMGATSTFSIPNKRKNDNEGEGDKSDDATNGPGVDAMLPMVLDILGQLTAKEEKAATRAVVKYANDADAFDKWRERFWQGHEESVRGRMESILVSTGSPSIDAGTFANERRFLFNDLATALQANDASAVAEWRDNATAKMALTVIGNHEETQLCTI